MRSVRLLILVVALGAGVAAAMLAMRLVNRPAPQAEVVAVAPPLETVEVLVATADIPMGGRVTEANVGWRIWPEVGLSASYIVRTMRPDAVTELVGSIARSQFLEGEPLKDSKLVHGDGGFLSAMLPSGMRAVAIRVDAARTAGGFILPNDRVDVLLVRTGSNGAAMSETFLSNIRVLAIDQTTNDTPEGATVVAQDTATLELNPEQAEMLTAAQQTGTLSLVLRSLADAQNDDGRSGAHAPRTGVDLVRFGVPSRVTSGQ